MKKMILVLATILSSYAHANTLLTCESANGFRMDANGGSSGHMFKVELQTAQQAVILQAGSKLLNKTTSYETAQLAPGIIQLTFKNYQRRVGIDILLPSIRSFSEVIVMAKSPDALVNYLKSEEMISDQDADDILKAGSKAASYTLTRDGFSSEEVGKPIPNWVGAYNPCR